MAWSAALLLLLTAACAARSAAGIFPDMAGVNDRTAQYVGPIRAGDVHAISSKLVVVGTAAHVVAALNVRTGEPAWRVVLPDGECRTLPRWIAPRTAGHAVMTRLGP
jgi:hypothetical protein